MKTVLVTGGAGYIGSHVIVELQLAGFKVVSVDNYSNSIEKTYGSIKAITKTAVTHYSFDVCDELTLSDVMEQENIDSVIHLAGFKSVAESIAQPTRYYKNNILSTLSLCQACVRHRVKHFVFSSSATVYGLPKFLPISEEHSVSLSSVPYGKTKLFCELILRDLHSSYQDIGVALLRYFNPVGAHASGMIGENPVLGANNLMPCLCQVAARLCPSLRIFGNDYDTPDGTGVRDFIHVVDLAKGHVAALTRLEHVGGCHTYNLGTGRGTSVLRLLRTFESVNKVTIPFHFSPRREGDVAKIWADPSRAQRELAWEAKMSLEEMVHSSWMWQLNMLQSEQLPR